MLFPGAKVRRSAAMPFQPQIKRFARILRGFHETAGFSVLRLRADFVRPGTAGTAGNDALVGSESRQGGSRP